jgi:hypothetical protein
MATIGKNRLKKLVQPSRGDIGLVIMFVVIGTLLIYNTLFLSGTPAGGYNVIHQFHGKFIYLIFTSLIYVIVGCGILPFLLSFSSLKSEKLCWTIVSVFVLCTAWFGAMPLHGRYMDPVFIMIIVSGLSVILQPEKIVNKYLMIGFGICAISAVFSSAMTEDIVNSATIVYVYLSMPIIVSLIGIAFLLVLLFAVRRPIPRKTFAIFVVCIIASSFIINDIGILTHLCHSSADRLKESAIARWIGTNSPLKLYFDESDWSDLWISYCLIQFWYQQEIPLINFTTNKSIPPDTYVLTTKTMNMPNYELVMTQLARFPHSKNTTDLFMYRAKKSRNKALYINKYLGSN